MRKVIICIAVCCVIIAVSVIPYFLSSGVPLKYMLGAVADVKETAVKPEFPPQDYILAQQKAEAERIEAEKKKQEIIAKEMRAIWVPYMSLQQVNAQKIDEIVKNAKDLEMNTIIFHVRPFGDALYKSTYYPWSHLLTGTQGTAPEDGFDPLAYAVAACHKNGLKIHAWINPLRVQSNGSNPTSLSQNNKAQQWITAKSTNVISYNNSLYYNPASQEVVSLIANGAAEIVRSYDVDGIHFDDYFYPAQDDSFNDAADYNAYKGGGGTLTLTQWRQENINKLVATTYAAIKSKNKDVVFGISPSGNIDNCLKMGADVKLWCSTDSYVDYICPQVYWTFDHKTMPFQQVCEQWCSLVTNKNIKLYVGLALYKAGSDLDEGTWLTNDENIKNQVLYLREQSDKIGGFMLYSYQSVSQTACSKEIAAYKSL